MAVWGVRKPNKEILNFLLEKGCRKECLDKLCIEYLVENDGY